MNTTHYDREKTEAIIAYLASKAHVNKTKLFKLLYLIDFKHYAKHNQSVTGASYEHWTYGPVPVQVWALIKNQTSTSFSVVKTSDDELDEVSEDRIISNDGVDIAKALSPSEIEILEDVLKTYGSRSASQLVDLTHKQTPWKITNHNEQIPYFLSYYIESVDLEEYAKTLREDHALVSELIKAGVEVA